MIILKMIIRVAVIVGVILLIPVFGNLLVPGWNWSPSDFVFAFAVLFITGMAIEMAAWKILRPHYKAATIAIIVLALVAFWVEMATGGVSVALQAL